MLFRSRQVPQRPAGRATTLKEVRFAVHLRNDNRERMPPLVRLKALCGPGDEGEPVILMPDED